MDLTRALAEFDGKHTDPLRVAAADYENADASTLEAECFGARAVAATWVVKALLEDGRALSLDMNSVFEALRTNNQWETTLHLLQSVQYAPEAALAQVFAIQELMANPKTLIRVWALDAFVRVAQVDRGFLPEARRLVDQALENEAASVRARARALVGIMDQSSP